MNSLQGQFLIATSRMPDPRFQEQVVYMCAHSEEGAMGLVINQPVPNVTMADILRSAKIPVPESELPPVYMGGPVELDTAFFLYTAEYETEHFLAVTETVHLSRDPEILRAIAEGSGPRHYLFMIGYAGWAPGQLENELGVNGWLNLPADDEVLFHTPDELKWQQAARKHGISIELYGDVIGSA
ncbi:MAG: YqgE/AlgH family protein [Desulfobacteraceae bacterium]|nr:YqgE/AlgH family protein [Desulfobacteraceae bacterium]